MNIKVKREIFNSVYLPYLFNYDNRTEVYYGGAGSGKSVFVAQKLLIKALNSKRKILVVRKVMATQKDSCWQLLLDTIEQFHLLPKTKINKSTFTIELPNGSMFLFKGLDDREKIKSIVNITDIWVEEATEITEDDYTQLDLRLRAKAPQLQLLLSFNPVSKANWCFRRFFKEGAPSNTLIVKTTYKDNRFLPNSYVDSLEAMIRTNPTYYKIYALGEFCSLSKLVYTNWKIEAFNHEDIEGALLVGLDFGFTHDPTALIASLLDEQNKRLYIFDEFTATGLTNDKIAAIIINKGYSKSRIIADSASPVNIEEIRRAGVPRIRPSVKGADSINQGIQKLQQYTLIVNPKCEQTIIELENYAWSKDKMSGEYINKPIDEFNHCLDALRYSLQCVTMTQKAKAYDISF